MQPEKYNTNALLSQLIFIGNFICSQEISFPVIIFIFSSLLLASGDFNQLSSGKNSQSSSN